MTERLISTAACIAEGAEWLCRVEPRFQIVLDQCAPLPLRLRNDGFPALLNAIISQQVSVASADAIWKRMEMAEAVTPQQIAQLTQDDLRQLGLSRQKASYTKALAEVGIDYDALRTEPTANVINTLTAVKGIGVWTAEIYAMFSLHRADVFAPGDLALQEGGRILFELSERPKEKELRELASAWSPWRSVAARALWAFYADTKGKEGVSG